MGHERDWFWHGQIRYTEGAVWILDEGERRDSGVDATYVRRNVYFAVPLYSGV